MNWLYYSCNMLCHLPTHCCQLHATQWTGALQCPVLPSPLTHTLTNSNLPTTGKLLLPYAVYRTTGAEGQQSFVCLVSTVNKMNDWTWWLLNVVNILHTVLIWICLKHKCGVCCKCWSSSEHWWNIKNRKHKHTTYFFITIFCKSLQIAFENQTLSAAYHFEITSHDHWDSLHGLNICTVNDKV